MCAHYFLRAHYSLFAALMTALVAAPAPAALAAQDSHYWSETYGTTATLLGGMVVGKVPDFSAAYYNPGRLAFTEQAAISLTARAYQLRTLNIDVAPQPYQGTGELGATNVTPTPSFAGGVLPIGDRRRVVTAYSYLARQSDDVIVDGSQYGTATGQPTGTELYWNRQVTENWYGVSVGYRLGEKTGIGATLFGAYRSQSQRSQFTTQVDAAPPQAALHTEQYEYTDWRLVLKVGISTDLDRWALGATVTAPGLHVLGSGSSFLAQVATASGTRFAWRSQDDVPVAFKSPLSIAAGVTRLFSATRVYATAEWFSAIAPYAVLDANPVVPTDGRPPFEDDVTLEQQSVLNWGLGIEHRVKARQAIYANFRVDHAAQPRNTAVNSTYDRWGTYHAGGGYAFRLASWDLVAGLTYSWGGDRFTAEETEQQGAIPVPPGTQASVTDRRLRALIAFNVRF
jgi:hypothetical protein